MPAKKRSPVLIALAVALGLACVASAAIAWLAMRPEPRRPCVAVLVRSLGRGAEQMETDLAVPIERAIASVPETAPVRTVSEDGQATIFACSAADLDGFALASAVQERLRGLSLPEDIDPPIVQRIGEPRAARWFTVAGATLDASATAQTAIRRVEALPGVGAVEQCGRARAEVAVILDPERMSAHGVTIADVARALRTAHTEVPAGRIETAGRELVLRTVASDTSDIARIAVSTNGLVTLGEVARIEDSAAPDCVAWRRGEQTLAVAVLLQDGVADVDGVREAIDGVLARRIADGAIRLFGDGARVETGRVLSAETTPETMRRTARSLAAESARLAGVSDVLALVDHDSIRILVAYTSPDASEEERRALLDVVHQRPGLVYLPDDGVRIRVSGPDRERALSIASQVRDRLVRDPAVLGAHVLDAAGTPELATIIDPARAAELGVTADDLADTLRAATTPGLEAAQLTRGSEVLDVVLRMPVRPDDPGSLRALSLRSRSGALVPIAELVNFEQRSTPARLLRVGGVRTIELRAFGDPSEREPTKLIDAVEVVSSHFELPPGYVIAFEPERALGGAR